MHVCIRTIRLPLLLSVLLLVAVSSAPSWGQDATGITTEQTQYTVADLPRLFEQAQQLLSQGQYEQALQLYTQMGPLTREAQVAGNFEPYLRAATGQAVALAGLQEYGDALEIFKEVLDLFETYAPALIARGEVYLQLNSPGNALPDFERAVKASRGNPPMLIDAMFGLGKSLVLLGQYDQAMAPLSKVIAQGQNAHMAEAHRLRGMANGGLDKFSEAIADLQQSIAMDPESHEGYFELGIVNLRRKEYQAAVDEFTKAIDRYTPPPGSEEPYVQGYLVKAAALIEVGKAATDEATRMAAYQAASDESQKLYSLVDEESRYTAGIRAAALLSRGVAERMSGELKTAILTFSQALELNPAASEAYFRRGICLLQLGEDKMAVSDFVQAAAINFEDPRNNLWEGFVYAKMGDYHEAIRAYGDAIAASDRFTPAYMNRGLAYMMLGEDEKAIADFNDALRIEPTNGDYYFKRGVAYAQLGELQKAADSLASAIEFDPGHREAYRQMGGVMQQLGRAELAEQYRQKAAELDAAQGTSAL